MIMFLIGNDPERAMSFSGSYDSLYKMSQINFLIANISNE